MLFLDAIADIRVYTECHTELNGIMMRPIAPTPYR